MERNDKALLNQQKSVIDWEAERKLFPICKTATFLQNAHYSPLSIDVHVAYLKGLTPWLWGGSEAQDFAEQVKIENHSLNQFDDLKILYQECFQMVSTIFKGRPSDWSFSTSTSHNMNLLAMMLSRKKGHILTLNLEYPSSVLPFQSQQQTLDILDIDFHFHDQEKTPTQKLLEKVTPQTKAVVLSHVQSPNGLVFDLEKIGTFLETKGIPFIVDATQSMGYLPLDVEKMKISALSCSTYKWLGSGAGNSLLYTNSWFREQFAPLPMGAKSYHEDQLREGSQALEIGTWGHAPLYALHAALKRLQRIGMQNIRKRIFGLRKMILDSDLLESVSPENPHYESALIPLFHAHPQNLAKKLQKHHILVNAKDYGLRVSPHFYNNEADIQHFLHVLKKCLK